MSLTNNTMDAYRTSENTWQMYEKSMREFQQGKISAYDLTMARKNYKLQLSDICQQTKMLLQTRNIHTDGSPAQFSPRLKQPLSQQLMTQQQVSQETIFRKIAASNSTQADKQPIQKAIQKKSVTFNMDRNEIRFYDLDTEEIGFKKMTSLEKEQIHINKLENSKSVSRVTASAIKPIMPFHYLAHPNIIFLNPASPRMNPASPLATLFPKHK
jgi:hypothetical protein